MPTPREFGIPVVFSPTYSNQFLKLGKDPTHRVTNPGRNVSFFIKNATGFTRFQTLIRPVLTIQNATGTILSATWLLFTTYNATRSHRGSHPHAGPNGPQELPQSHGFGTESPDPIDGCVRILLRTRLSPASRF